MSDARVSLEQDAAGRENRLTFLTALRLACDAGPCERGANGQTRCYDALRERYQAEGKARVWADYEPAQMCDPCAVAWHVQQAETILHEQVQHDRSWEADAAKREHRAPSRGKKSKLS